MGIVASAICCCSSCAVSSATCCCNAGKGASAMGRQAAKAANVALLGFGVLLAWVGQRYFDDFSLGELDFECDGQDGDLVCSSNGFVYRLSLMMTVFFFVMMLLTLPFPTMSGERRWAPLGGDNFMASCWAFKLILFIGLVCVTPALPSSVFDDADNGWAWACRIVSALFLVLQVLMLIDFGFQANEDLYNRSLDESGDVAHKGWLVAIIVTAVIFNAAALGGMIFMFTWYSDCATAVAYIAITFVAYLVYTIPLTLFREKLIDQPGAVLPSGVVALYTTFLLWSALESLPEEGCRPFDDGSDLVVFAGVGFAVVTLVWTSYTASRRSQNLLGGASDPSDSGQTKPDFTGIYTVGTDANGKDILARDTEEGRGNAAATDSDNINDRLDDKPWLFHLFMITGAMYSAMLLTNWGVEDAAASAAGNAAIGEVSFWVKIISQWLCIALYVWILVAPKVLPGREFDF